MKKWKKILIVSALVLSVSLVVLIPVLYIIYLPKAPVMSLRVGVYENSPKLFSDGNGNWEGFWPDIVGYIATAEQWAINYVEGTWSECLTRLENGEIDIMVDIAYSEARNVLYDFNNASVFSNWGVFYTNETNVYFGFYDLEGMNVATMNNSIHTNGTYGLVEVISRFNINCTLILCENYYKVFEMLSNGTADAGVVNRLFGLANDDNYDVVQTSLIFNPVDLKFAFPKAATLNEHLIQRIDYNVQVLQADPDSIYYQSIEKYLMGVPVIEVIPEWIFYVIIIIVLVGITFIGMSIYLKRTVNRRTEELRVSNAELEILNKILIDTIPSGVLFGYEDGKLSFINQNFKNLYNQVYEEAIDVSTNILNLPDSALTIPIKSKILETKKSQAQIESSQEQEEITLKSSIYLELFSSKIYLKQAYRKAGYLFVVNDVTPFKELEKMRQEIYSMVSHELRTPITNIDLSLNNFIEFREMLNEEDLNKTLSVMKRNVGLLINMVEDLLITAQHDNVSIEINKINCNLSNIVKTIQNELRDQINENNLTLKVEMDPQVIIKADVKRISQVFRNIITNAVKYSPIGSEIRIQAIDDYKGPENQKGLPGVLLKFIDNGIGIPQSDLQNMFQKYHRGSNVGSKVGTGLGLSIAKILVELHDGSISVESEEGKGTTFSVFLPKSS